MTKEEFLTQAERLKATWPTSFPDEKVKLIWVACNEHDIRWFEKLVSDLIANNRQAPLPADFIEASRTRTREDIFKFPRPHEIEPCANSIFSKEDIAEIFSMIQKRMRGEISSKELDDYGRMIGNAVKENQREKGACMQCTDGIIFSPPTLHGTYSVSKCHCDLGKSRQENWSMGVH